MEAGSISFVWIMIAVMIVLSSHKEEHIRVAMGILLGFIIWGVLKWDIGLCVCMSLLVTMNFKRIA